jgi:taurine dioxygenase
MRLDPITTTLGSEVTDVDLATEIDSLGDQIHDALVERGVLVFRDQALSPDVHLRLAAALGELGVPHPLYPSVDGAPQINIIRNDAAHPPEAEFWHSDLTCKPNPPFASVLRGVDIPPVGGDTLWVDMRAACAALPSTLRQRVEGRLARNTLAHAFRFLSDFGQTDRQDRLGTERADTVAEHPVIIRHPVSDVEVLFVNESFSEGIVGLDERTSADVLEELFAFARHPRFQMRLRWRRDTVVIWDNWSTQHFASGDHYPTHTREMHRITVASSRRAGLFSGSSERVATAS